MQTEKSLNLWFNDWVKKKSAGTGGNYVIISCNEMRSHDINKAETEGSTWPILAKYIGSTHRQCTTWLCAIAKNVLMNHRRKQKQASTEEVEEQTVASTEEYVLQRMGQEAVFAAIHRISEPGREVLYLRLLGGMSFSEIGSILGKSENWARVCFYRAKQTLIKELKEHENDASL